MKNKAIALVFVLSVLLSGCKNIFEDTIANKNSKEAQEEKLELALDEHDYDTIILMLDPNPVATAAAVNAPNDYIHLAGLNSREKYLLQMAWLGKSGFNAVDVLSDFLKDDSDSTSDILLRSLAPAGGAATTAVLNEKQKLYKQVKAINSFGIGDKDIQTAAGIAATLDTLMAVTRVANELVSSLPGTDVSFVKGDPNYIGDVIAGKSQTEIESAIATALPVLDDIVDNITLLNDTITRLVPGADTDMYEKFDEYIYEFKDPVTGSIDVDPGKLAKFIYDQWH
jgi:hypothetical protein